MMEMRSDMWNIRLTAREAVHGQHHPQQRDLLEVMNSFSHFGDAAPAGKINRRISQPITSLAAALVNPPPPLLPLEERMCCRHSPDQSSMTRGGVKRGQRSISDMATGTGFSNKRDFTRC
ncbi:uncharacterized protein ACWYII_018504 isoform 2-T2 [Salvelinus alpinus]